MAKMAAMSRPHVSVTMKNLKQKGFVDYGRSSPLTINVSKLEKHLIGK
ncbi:MAG: helix-turn-helix domain-containing protein [Aridibacter sp.]